MTTMRVVGECFFWYRLTRVFPDKFHRAVKRLLLLLCFISVCFFPLPPLFPSLPLPFLFHFLFSSSFCYLPFPAYTHLLVVFPPIPSPSLSFLFSSSFHSYYFPLLPFPCLLFPAVPLGFFYVYIDSAVLD